MTESIRAFVLRRLREGASCEDVQREALFRFPYRLCSWNYVCAMRRQASAPPAAASTAVLAFAGFGS